METSRITALFELARPELRGFLARMVARPPLAEDLVQSTFVKAYEARDRAPEEASGFRRWLFRIATNLAIDELRRHSSWRESVVHDLRETAEQDQHFLERAGALAGTPETALIAKEHLAACFSCVLRSFPPQKAAALLLREVHGFAVGEVAELLDASLAQAKNWLQEARSRMEARYGASCALVAKNGVCHQCVELADFFGAVERHPMPGAKHFSARLDVLKELKESMPSAWQRLLFDLIDDDGDVRPLAASRERRE